MDFLSIPRATLALNYLDTNSTTHASPFSAIAELVDNAYDADAATLEINLVQHFGDYYLEFKDNGTGMSQEEVAKTILFGHSKKTSEKIGRYGNGMKSGGFNLGRELFMITKRDDIYTCLLISHAFHADNEITDEVLCPCVSMDNYGNPVENTTRKFPWTLEEHEKELEIIMKYAPLRGRTLQEMFGRFTDRTGTLIIIAHLKKTGNDGKRLGIALNGNDIETRAEDATQSERSLREYLSILYLYPKMRIILCEELVQPKKICANWIGRYHSEMSASPFNDGHNKNVADMISARDRLQQQINGYTTDTQYRNESAQTVNQVKETRTHFNRILTPLQTDLATCDGILKDLQNANRKKTFKVIMGCDIQDRENNGMHFYINNRLITWGHKSAIFRSNTTNTLGISLYVNVGYDVFSPTHNKQSFESQNDFKLLVKKCNALLNIYQKVMEYQWIPNHLKRQWNYQLKQDEDVWAQFWLKYGYTDATTPNLPRRALTDEAKRMVIKFCGVWLLCQRCKTWRCTDGTIPPREHPYFSCTAIHKVCYPSRSFVGTDPETKVTQVLPAQAPLPPPPVTPARRIVFEPRHQSPVDRMAANRDLGGRRMAERSVEEARRHLPRIKRTPTPEIDVVGEVEDEDSQPVEVDPTDFDESDPPGVPLIVKNEQVQVRRSVEVVDLVDDEEEQADDDQEQEDDEERVNNVQEVRPQKVYAKKPAGTKVIRRRQHDSSSDDSFGEEEEASPKKVKTEPSTSSQRLKSTVKPAVSRPGVPEGQVLISKEHLDNYNQFLVWFNTTPISSGSKRVIDVAQMIKTRQGMINREKRTAVALGDLADRVLDEFQKHSRATGIRVPARGQFGSALERLTTVNANITEAKRRKAARK
ncbi:hypothetical protein GCK72_008535 [Caenorhabditis remanei]|uniref:Morc S5 domain-containing protein n=1 Tax=Caenorhabditis remanei TaxID=31234 RepID=A0A6A5GXU2_CAERE|nr:hypothetical protein GCK72_008535 [Caenorhabditis remanei]KAF1760288.1 hypothetical protein GCK72_008535 [Caenorhabditis remanei]